MLSRHEHGGEVYALARRLRVAPDRLIDFSSNANIFAADITASLVAATPYPFLHYPDSSAGALTQALAAYEGVTPDRVLPGNGGSDLIWQLLQSLTPRKVLCIGPIFSEYVNACEALNIPYEILPTLPENDFCCTHDDLKRLWENDADLVVLCSPNNPATVAYPNMAALLRMLRAPRLVIDNSYREFLYGMDEYEEQRLKAYAAMARPGVSVLTLHSFTKFFCCPGIRLGYLLGERAQIARIAARRPAWTLNPFAQAMGVTFLENIEAYRQTLPALREAALSMGRELRRLPLLVPDLVFEGPGFLCCGLAPGYDTAKVCAALLARHIVVRDCDTIPGMPRGFFRVQARPREDAERLIEALAEV